MDKQRVQYSRQDILDKFTDFPQAPETLVKKFEKKPFCHILSTYVIKPVANDKNPFVIHHKNKQPIFVSNRAKQQQQVKTEASDEEDDEFETIKTHQKRIKKPVVHHGYHHNPQFPASDPSKIVMVAPGQKPVKKEDEAEEEIKRVEQPKQEEAKPEEKPAPKKVVEQPKKVEETKPVEKPKAAKKAPENPFANEIMMAIQQAQGGSAPAEPKKEETKEQKPKAAAKGKGKQQEARPQTAQKKEETKKAPEYIKDLNGQEKPAKKVASLEKVAQEQPHVKKAQPAAADPNDYIAQMQRAQLLTEEQDAAKKAKKANKKGKKGPQPEGAVKTNFSAKNKTGMDALYQ